MTEAALETVHVEFIPERIDPGKLYVSLKYNTAIHLCACGCGEQVVTPIGAPQGWTFSEREGHATVRPSIGSYQIPCRSHYWIRDGKVVWC